MQKMLASNHPVTIRDLAEQFAENSFAVLFLILMAIPALPLPTGGITHVFEIIVMLISIELIAGRKNVWLPKSWLNKSLPKKMQASALPRFIKIIRWVEKHSRPRLSRLLVYGVIIRMVGLFIFVFTLFAFLSPPFSGLDTLPSLGVLLMSLALIFSDGLLMVIGILVGCSGIAAIFLLGRIVFQLF